MRPTTGHWSSAVLTRDSTCRWRWYKLCHFTERSAACAGFYSAHRTVMARSVSTEVTILVSKTEQIIPSCVNSPQLRGNNPCVLLAEQGRGKNFIVYKPNIGKQAHPESLDNLHQRYRKVTGSYLSVQGRSCLRLLIRCFDWYFCLTPSWLYGAHIWGLMPPCGTGRELNQQLKM